MWSQGRRPFLKQASTQSRPNLPEDTGDILLGKARPFIELTEIFLDKEGLDLSKCQIMIGQVSIVGKTERMLVSRKGVIGCHKAK